MAAEIWNIEEIRDRKARLAANRPAKRFWGASGEDIHLAFERAMAPSNSEQRALVARLANYWESLSLRERNGAARAAAGGGGSAGLPPAA